MGRESRGPKDFLFGKRRGCAILHRVTPLSAAPLRQTGALSKNKAWREHFPLRSGGLNRSTMMNTVSAVEKLGEERGKGSG